MQYMLKRKADGNHFELEKNVWMGLLELEQAFTFKKAQKNIFIERAYNGGGVKLSNGDILYII